MSDKTEPFESDLSLSSLKTIERICEEFEQAWKADQQPQIESFLCKATSADSSALFEQLLLLDLDYRTRPDDPTG